MARCFSSTLPLSNYVFLLIIIHILSLLSPSSSIPFILLHGIGMQCNDEGTTFYQSQLSMLSGSKGSCLEIGNGAYDSWTMPLDQQVKLACDQVKTVPDIQGGYNLVGLAQGSLVGRGVIEMCDDAPSVNNFISIGGPNAGVNLDVICSGGLWCSQVDWLYGMGVYTDYVQTHLAPSGYAKLPNDIPGYLRGCRFLPKLNNEIPNMIDPIYKQRFSSLHNLVLIMFENDGVVNPALSSWFGYYPDGDNTTVLAPQMTKAYTEDLFGLRSLDEAGKVKFIKVPGMHLEITIPELQKYVVPYLVDVPSTVNS